MSSGDFSREMDQLSDMLRDLGGADLEKIADWTMQSASWGVLRRIRKVWPIDTGLSWGKWGFKKIKPLSYIVYNNALNTEQAALKRRSAIKKTQKSVSGGQRYAGWVYAKGDKARRPIAPGIVSRAINEESKTLAENFAERVGRYTVEY